MSRSLFDKLYKRYGETVPGSQIGTEVEALIGADQTRWASSLSATCVSKLSGTRVAVVGGGFAGMMAAWSLCPKGIEVVVFEARPSVGGRVWSNENFTKGPRTIEFGAELVGANHPLWIKTALQLGVGFMTRTEENHYAMMGLKTKLRIDGKDISDKDAEQLTNDMRAIFVNIGNDASLINDAAQPWTPPDPTNRDEVDKFKKLKAFDNMSVDDKLTGLIKSPPPGLRLNNPKLAYRGVQIQLENNLVTSLGKINYLALLCLVKAGRFCTDQDKEGYLGFWQFTETFRCTDGCQTLVKKMVAQLMDPKAKYKFKLLTNTKVTHIETDSNNPPKPVKLKWTSTAAGNRVDPSFDYIILAVPPSVWDKIAITPQHPKGLGAIQMGPAVKFFSNLKDRFWVGEKAAPSGVSSDLGMIWEGTDNQMQVGDSEVELSVFAGGPATTGRDTAYYKRKLAELYPGYTASNKGRKTEPADWPNTEFIRTGYSCPQKKHIFTVAQALQQPVGTRLFLAGEHTQTDFFGFMEGALRSGRRAAAAVIDSVCPAPLVAG